MSDVVRWWWVRHAPVRAVGFCGWSDPDVDLTDEQSLATLRSALPDEATLVTSDLRRAVRTADVLARRTWTRAEETEMLREQNFGAWEGRGYDDGDDLAAFWADPAGSAPPGGESFSQVCERVARYVLHTSRSGRKEIVAVAHAGAIRAALALALTLPPSQALNFEISPLSLTRIDWIADSKAWRIGSVNQTL